jgi:hypothetical protein
MSSLNVNDSPEEDQNKPEPDEESQPAFEPKRIIHLSKPLTDIGEKPSWLGTIFRHKIESDSMDNDEDEGEGEDVPTIQPDPYSEPSEPESTPTRGDRTIPDLSDKKINPGLRLRALLSGGKTPPAQVPESETQPPTKQTGPRLVYLYFAVGISLLANAILVIALVMMSGRINSLKTNMNGLLSGLYGNFNGFHSTDPAKHGCVAHRKPCHPACLCSHQLRRALDQCTSKYHPASRNKPAGGSECCCSRPGEHSADIADPSEHSPFPDRFTSTVNRLAGDRPVVLLSDR